jgi:hypothetical protein
MDALTSEVMRLGGVAVVLGAVAACGKFIPESEGLGPDASTLGDGGDLVDGSGPASDSSSGSSDGSAEASTADGGLVFAWEGDEVAGWAWANVYRTETTDCCTCSGTCTSTAALDCNNTTSAALGTTVAFSSGPASPENHRYDGFYAWRPNVGVQAGKKYRAEIRIVSLSAKVSPADFGSEPWQQPEWSFSARDDNGTTLAEKKVLFGTWKCASCTGSGAELGAHAIEFTAVSSNVDLVLRAQHRSSQCAANVHEVRVEVDHVRMIALP